MNKIKKLAVVTAAMALTATLASAQLVSEPGDETLDFSITVAMEGAIEVLPVAANTDADADNLLMSGIAYAQGTSKHVGTIMVATNMGSWDVIVNSQNDGVLTAPAYVDESIRILKNARTNQDVKLVVNVCAVKASATLIAADVKANATEVDCTADHLANRVGHSVDIETSTNGGQINSIGAGQLPGLTEQSIGAVLKATGGGKFVATDGGDDGQDDATDFGKTNPITYIPVYAYINAQLTDLVGNDTYSESLDFTLVSGF